jgi:hypothetical protein
LLVGHIDTGLLQAGRDLLGSGRFRRKAFIARYNVEVAAGGRARRHDGGYSQPPHLITFIDKNTVIFRRYVVYQGDNTQAAVIENKRIALRNI